MGKIVVEYPLFLEKLIFSSSSQDNFIISQFILKWDFLEQI